MAYGIPKQILIATTNPGKFSEMLQLLDGVDTTWVSLQDFPDIEPPAETGATYEDNALLKARYYSEKTQLPAIADDSGLEILALGGWPGLHSNRPLGDNRRLSDSELIALVLKRMEAYPHEPQRRARMVCAAAYVDPGNEIELCYRGSLYGVIGKAPKGKNGFGYDPLFYVPDCWKTIAQMTSEEKNRFSHRRHAMVTLKPRIIHEFTKREGFAV